jgi:YgiT-type zinc finger domain-containing protein
MWTPEIEEEWTRLTAQALAEMGDWRAAHPRATLAEIEREVDARLATARAKLLEAAAGTHPGGDPALAAEPPVCPVCGGGLVVEGARTRRLRTTQEREIALTRRYARCPACGTGVFPPR